MRLPEARLHFAGETFTLHADGALFWPAESTLVVGDLHFEKASFLAMHGALVPPYDTLDTLARLMELIAHYKPQRLILLGDSFHDAQAWQRMDESMQGMLLALHGAVPQVLWLEGNHDRSLQEHPLGWFTHEVQVGPILFSHEPREAEQPLIIGHFHPKAQVRLPQGTVRGRCLIHSARLMILPSFGSFTGGLNIQDPAIASLFAGEPCNVYMLYGKSVFPL